MAIPLSGNNICEMRQNWWGQTSLYFTMGIIRLILPCLGCWEGWEERNRRVSEGTCFNLHRITSHVDSLLKNLHIFS